MKNQNLFFVSIILFGLSACTSNPKNEQEANASMESDKEFINLVAQEWPGAEPKAFDMPIDKGLDKLEFADPDDVEIADTDLIIGIPFDSTQIAIPITYLEGFEVANFKYGDENLIVTWCPLVGSSRIFEGDPKGFDFGRGLVDNNLLMVDRETESVWNQLSNQSIHGERLGENLNALPTIQSTWGFWKEKYPDTKLVINRDTSGAVFPSVVFENPHYTTWVPGTGKYFITEEHQIENLGLGVTIDTNSLYFPLDTLFDLESPLSYELESQNIKVYFDEDGLTAWVENDAGKMIPSTIAYQWAWMSFYPNSRVLGE